MTTLVKVPLTVKEREALMWCLGQIVNFPDRTTQVPDDPLFVLLAAGHERGDIMFAAGGVTALVHRGFLIEPLSPAECDVLRVCVENTSWIEAYRTGTFTADSPVMIEEALATLRGLAAKLDCFGIEVNHIPHQ